MQKLIKEKWIEGHSLVIYMNMGVIDEVIFHPAIFIQWGVSWDVYYRRYSNTFMQGILNIKKRLNYLILGEKLLKIIKKMDKIITVDTNFQNWLRAYCTWNNYENKYVYIPNFSQVIPEKLINQKMSKIQINKILFARRFETFRGTFLWANVVEKLSKKYPEVEFKFIGRGKAEAEKHLRDKFKNFKNVNIYESSYDNMMKEHYDADIEVIPSIGSEGTSFSLIEAMAAGCAVVSSNVGGLSNVVIPGYNGILVQPTEENFEREVSRLIENPALTKELGRRAYDVVKVALNKERWEKQILEVINGLFKNE